MHFPLGAYPVEPMTPRQGYALEFESSDADADPLADNEEPEQWPDRYLYDVVVSATRLRSLCLQLLALMPPRVYPILDYIGHDAFREVDPYISYELIGQDRYLDAFRRYQPFLLEDGMCGFGAMSEEPFMYFFVDEHKIITIRVEPDLKDRVDRLLEAYDLPLIDEPAGADAAAHEHRSVLATPRDEPDMLSADEAVEWLREEWRLTLNVDPEVNVDESGRELGYTPFRCIARWPGAEGFRYAEVLVVADCLAEAEDLAFDACGDITKSLGGDDEGPAVVAADRMTVAQLAEALGLDRPDSAEIEHAPAVLRTRLLDV